MRIWRRATTAPPLGSWQRWTATEIRDDGSSPSSRQAQIFAQHGFRGCAFIAAAEAPLGGLVEQASGDNRTWMRALFIHLAEQGGATDPSELARQLQIIFDGASVAA